jgi:RNA polymerase sigma factor (sigma-70 family)
MGQEGARVARGNGQPLSPSGSGRRAVEAIWRIESARIVATLARYTGDFPLAEDVAQEALAEALVTWSREGVPTNPAGWLMTVGRRRAVDAYRRRDALDERYAGVARDLGEGAMAAGGVPEGGADDMPWDPDRIDDDVLRLVFISSHPVLSREGQIALTLRVVGGLTTDEIARAFLTSTPTVAARITRAKKTLAAAQVPFEVPDRSEYPQRLSAVLSVIYLIYNEGYSASFGRRWVRDELCTEALRLGRVLAALVPEEPEVHGLVSLMEFQSSRFAARTGGDGQPVLLEDQDRTRWDRAQIRRGVAALQRASDTLQRKEIGWGPYALQAALAECHAVSASAADTDWKRIVTLYDGLLKISPSPVIELNRAVAVAMTSGPDDALRIVDGITGLDGSYLLPSVRGELLARLGRNAEAADEFDRAAAANHNDLERRVLENKAASARRGTP